MSRRLPLPAARQAGFARAALRLAAGWLLAVLLGAAALPGWAQSGARAESPPRWSQLTPAQRQALRPLERDWSSIGTDHKEKWLDIAARMPRMPVEERALVQARMAEWARLSPEERGRARLAYQELKRMPLQDRKDRWQAYEALPEERRRQLQQRAVPPPPIGKRVPSGRAPLAADDGRPQIKSNIVPHPADAAPPRPVAPAVVRAGPGVSTQLMSRGRAPPPHQQTGLPKITATPDFVDRHTLLPQRGPQGAGMTRPREREQDRSRGRD